MLNTAISILNTLNTMGYEAYIVGGFVREFLLKEWDFEILRKLPQKPQKNAKDEGEAIDIDIASSARPEIIIKTFDKVIKTGIDYGTVTIVLNGYSFEHTTFRKDLTYLENSRSAIVSYSKTLEEDVKRRDFTINALAMDSSGKIFDFFNGKKDLENKRIRAIGKADMRFQEDALRKLRAVRFAGSLGFEIEPETFKAIKEKPSLKDLSKERIKSEFDKILSSPNKVRSLRLLKESSLIGEIIPDFKNGETFNRAFMRISHLDAGLPLIYAGLFFDWDYEKAKECMLKLKFSKREYQKVLHLISLDRNLPPLTKEDVRVWMAKVGLEHICDFSKLLSADFKGNEEKDQLGELQNLIQISKEIRKEKNVFSRADLAVSGKDLIRALKLDKEDYPLLNQIFSELLNLCIRNPERNNQAFLIEEAKKIRAKH